MPLDFTPRDALIVVDLQIDFCPGGALAVPGGDEIVPVVNRLAARAHAAGASLVASRDCHPPDHVSFREQGGPWPPHCVRGTPGAALHPDLVLPGGVLFVEKGRDRDADEYSAFAGDLAERLARRGVDRVAVCGLALDYCVRATALDGLAAGLGVTLVTDATRAVDVEEGDGARALEELAGRGVALATAP